MMGAVSSGGWGQGHQGDGGRVIRGMEAGHQGDGGRSSG